jgi:hypothetical protein
MEMNGQRDVLAALTPWKVPFYPLHRRLDKPYSQSEPGVEGKKEKVMNLPGVEPRFLYRLIAHPVAKSFKLPSYLITRMQ